METEVVYTKDVASCTSVNGAVVRGTKDDASGDPHTYYASVSETISNAYPSYMPTIKLEVAHLGTVPVHLQLTTTYAGTHPQLGQYIDLWFWEIVDMNTADGTSVTYSGTGCESFEAQVDDYQLHGCHILYITLKKHIMQEKMIETTLVTCPEAASVTLTHTVVANQFNYTP